MYVNSEPQFRYRQPSIKKHFLLNTLMKRKGKNRGNILDLASINAKKCFCSGTTLKNSMLSSKMVRNFVSCGKMRIKPWIRASSSFPKNKYSTQTVFQNKHLSKLSIEGSYFVNRNLRWDAGHIWSMDNDFLGKW